MKVIIVGSGLIGLSTAYSLRNRGHEILVIDRAEGPGCETSLANGALLTPSMSEPWNAPGSWRVMLASVGRSDSALQLRLRALPAMARWGIMFLRNSSVQAFERNALSNLRLALFSLQVMRTWREHAPLEYGRTARGSLRVFRDPASLERAAMRASRLASHGLTSRCLSSKDAVSLEPALVPVADQLVGAIHYATDETGDAHRFCVLLAEHLRQHGVELRYRTEVSSLEVRSGRLTALVSGDNRFVADRYVVAAGSYSAPLLGTIGVRVPVQPAKGYSITLTSGPDPLPLSIPVIDDQWHAVVVPLEGAIRVAGTAEFARYDLSIDPARIRNLTELLKAVLPRAPLDPATAKPWCGLRAMSADGVPIIGTTPVSNLFTNTGHGHLGWTMAAGSAELLADLMCDHSPCIEPAPYALGRFKAAA
jgi:D-amino-acid dehydrogenase